jgi:hypothetical protein
METATESLPTGVDYGGGTELRAGVLSFAEGDSSHLPTDSSHLEEHPSVSCATVSRPFARLPVCIAARPPDVPFTPDKLARPGLLAWPHASPVRLGECEST